MIDASQMAAGLRNFMPVPNPANSPQAIAGALQGQQPIIKINTDLPPSDSPEEALHNQELRAATAIPQFGAPVPEPALPFRSLVGKPYLAPNANENIPASQRQSPFEGIPEIKRITDLTPEEFSKLMQDPLMPKDTRANYARAYLQRMEQNNPDLVNYAKALNKQQGKGLTPEPGKIHGVSSNDMSVLNRNGITEIGPLDPTRWDNAYNQNNRLKSTTDQLRDWFKPNK